MPKAKASVGKLREAVREVLNMSPGYRINDAGLARSVDELLPLHEVRELETLQAAEWNLGKGYVDSYDNEDTDEREWFITSDGQAKERVG